MDTKKVTRRPCFTVHLLSIWCAVYFRKHGKYPTKTSGLIETIDTYAGTTWNDINNALRYGLRGIAGGSSLSNFIQQEFDKRNKKRLPELTEKMIIAWMEEYARIKGYPPKRDAGNVKSAPGEVWNNLDVALKMGRRGLSGGSSLDKLAKLTLTILQCGI